MVKRLFDIVVSSIALILCSPICLIAALGIKLSSKGPVLYKAKRVGKDNTVFTMHKFRTMHVQTRNSNAITATNDPRVFGFGKILRTLKIDEIPQLVDVIRGKMSLVGPRPEDPRIVEKYYTALGMETLRVLPGLTSPGSVYYYTHADQYLDSNDTEQAYVNHLLPIKLALDLVYIRNNTFFYDLRIIFRTLFVIIGIMFGRRRFKEPPEMSEAKLLAANYEKYSGYFGHGSQQQTFSM